MKRLVLKRRKKRSPIRPGKSELRAFPSKSRVRDSSPERRREDGIPGGNVAHETGVGVSRAVFFRGGTENVFRVDLLRGEGETVVAEKKKSPDDGERRSRCFVSHLGTPTEGNVKFFAFSFDNLYRKPLCPEPFVGSGRKGFATPISPGA